MHVRNGFAFFLALMVLGAVHPAAADVGAIKPKALPKITIAPHRAIYEMSLASTKNGSNIAGVDGRLMFEWADACDGWATQQRMKMHFSYAEGEETNVTTSEASWESKDGKHYNFNIQRLESGKDPEVYRGKATMDQDGGNVVYTEPAGKKESLPRGTLFPSAHTILILQKAQMGDKLFFRRVFDGSDEDGSNDISAFISPAVAVKADVNMDAKLLGNPLLNKEDWFVHMAFFQPVEGASEPDYEMNLDLLANGVVRKITIDYGDFSVQGILKEIEPLPASGC